MSGWLFFLVAQAYYSGAMTMFFTFAPRAPFTTLREAMNAFPEWKMVMDREEVHPILFRAEEGDPDFVVCSETRFIDRLNV